MIPSQPSSAKKLLIVIALVGIVSTVFGQRSVAESPWPWLSVSGGNDPVTLLLMGDTNIQHRGDPATAYENVAATLNAADIAFANLEGPFAGTSADPLVPDIANKEGWQHSAPEMVQALVAAGIDGVGIANNVTYPHQALLRSMSVLDEVGIGYSGGGNDLQAAHRPLIFNRNGTRVGFLQYTTLFWPYGHTATQKSPGVASIRVSTAYMPPEDVLEKPGAAPVIVTTVNAEDQQLMVADIRALRQQADIIVVSYHWGLSSQRALVDYQPRLAHAAIDAGADIIMGHGPHVIQPIEVFGGKPIFYSLANFVFDWMFFGQRNLDGLLVHAVIDAGELVRVSAVPVRRDLDDNNPALLDPTSGAGREFFEQLVQLSGGENAPLRLDGKEIVVEGINSGGS